jgi:hypothetical protein
LQREIVHFAQCLEDNTGVIYLVKNQQVGQHMKHIDVPWHFIRELYKTKELKVIGILGETYGKGISTPENIGTKLSETSMTMLCTL